MPWEFSGEAAIYDAGTGINGSSKLRVIHNVHHPRSQKKIETEKKDSDKEEKEWKGN